MSEDDNSANLEEWIEPELEARVVAWVLGEASAFEAAELERLVEEKPELAIFKRRIEAVNGLVRMGTKHSPRLRMSEERRAKLLESIGAKPITETSNIVILKGKPQSSFTKRILAIAAILVLAAMLLGLLMPAVSGSLDRARRPHQTDAGIYVPEGESATLTIAADGMDFEPERGNRDLAIANTPQTAAADTASVKNKLSKLQETLAQGEETRLPQREFARASEEAPSSSYYEGSVQLAAEREISRRQRPSIQSQLSAKNDSSSPYDEDFEARPEPSQKPASEALPDEDQRTGGKVAVDTSPPPPAPEKWWSADLSFDYDGLDLNNVPNLGQLSANGDPSTPPVFPVTPSTPTEWENRNGEFEGFINYGSPLKTISKNGKPNVLSDNEKNKPIFADPNIAEREIARRQPNVIHAGVAIQKAEEALNSKDVEVAAREYQKALELVPEAMKTDSAYRKALEGYGEATVLLAQQRIAEGRREDAKSALENYLAANPDYRPALQIRKHLEDPDYYDPSVTPGSIDKVEEVKRLHREAKGFKDTGRYDLAHKRYEQILNVDKYNIAARHGVEQVTHEQNKYWETSYDQTRSKLLGSVQKAWEMPYRRFEQDDRGSLEKTKTREMAVKEKLAQTVIPKIEFNNISVREAVSRLQQEIRKQDPTGSPDAGVNMVLKLKDPAANASLANGNIPGIPSDATPNASVAPTDPADIKINLNLENVPAQEALKYVTELAGLKYTIEPHAVAIVPHWVNTDVMITKEYRVPPDFLKSNAGEGDSNGTGAPISAQKTTVDELKAKGVKFPAGASAIYIPAGNRLVVRNTETNLDLIGALVEHIEEKQKELEANELAASTQPFSTFSLHVSDVSFKLAKDALAAGKLPERDRVRPEEFYNAFDYGDPNPRANEEVACRIEQSAHPLLQQRNLVRIGVKVGATGRSGGQPLRLTLLLDTSGSMEREDRAASIQKAIGALAGLLGPNDKIAMIGFARKPRLLSDWIPGDQAKKLVEIAERTPSEGGTNIEEALKLAAEIARKELAGGARNRIVLFTDGAVNLGDADPEQLAVSIQKLRDEGIAFDACGVGAAGLNDEILEALTRKGDGRYYFLNSPEDADEGFASQLAGAFRPAAENVKVQVHFNPARVGKYRLIGFEEHRLKKEDFRNDKVDAAELAAEESAVAIYQVETLPGGEGELGDVFVRFRKPGTENMVERSWTMAYDPQTPAFDQASPTMQLAGSAALLAEKLKADAVASYVDLQPLYPIVNSLRGAFPNNARVKDLGAMFEQTRKILGE